MNETIERNLLICSAYILLSENMYYFIWKLPGFWPAMIYLLTAISLISYLFYFIYFFLDYFKGKERRHKNRIIKLLFSVLLIAQSYSPFTFNENTFQSNVIIEARYEGSASSSIMYLRNNGKFEILQVGFMAYSSYRHGTWSKQDSILLLDMEEDEYNGILNDSMVIRDNYYLLPLNDGKARMSYGYTLRNSND